jgi:hypothetical protein
MKQLLFIHILFLDIDKNLSDDIIWIDWVETSDSQSSVSWSIESDSSGRRSEKPINVRKKRSGMDHRARRIASFNKLRATFECRPLWHRLLRGKASLTVKVGSVLLL